MKYPEHPNEILNESTMKYPQTLMKYSMKVQWDSLETLIKYSKKM